MYMLRCVGNLVADDDDNRETIITHNIMDGLANTVKGLQSPEEADLSVNVTFNICNDYGRQSYHLLTSSCRTRTSLNNHDTNADLNQSMSASSTSSSCINRLSRLCPPTCRIGSQR